MIGIYGRIADIVENLTPTDHGYSIESIRSQQEEIHAIADEIKKEHGVNTDANILFKNSVEKKSLDDNDDKIVNAMSHLIQRTSSVATTIQIKAAVIICIPVISDYLKK